MLEIFTDEGVGTLITNQEITSQEITNQDDNGAL